MVPSPIRREGLPRSEITYATAAEPFAPKPLIADILRTRYCVPGSVFLVEAVDSIPTSRSRRWRALRLMLGDGELCIQALLVAAAHRYVDGGEVVVGAYVKLNKFRYELMNDTPKDREPKPDVKGKAPHPMRPKQTGGVVYLVVDDLVVVGWHNALLELEDEPAPAGTAGLQQKIPDSSGDDSEPDFKRSGQYGEDNRQTAPEITLLEEIADADDDFEVMTSSDQRARQKRTENLARTPAAANSTPAVPSRLPWYSTDLSRPLKLTPLRSIPNLPYKQNWIVNILAVVSSLSNPEPSTLPPYTQRKARLADPSTPKHVLLTVFLDPEQFTPQVGSVILLLGVKNHRFDGGSLKKYLSDQPKDGEKWWYENPTGVDWCDVAGLRQWWNERMT